MQKKFTILLMLAILLAACAPGQSAQDVDSLVSTVVAQTMEANDRIEQAVNQTLTAQVPLASPTLAFTPTLVPTFEPLIIITDTPLPATSTPFSQPAQAQSTPQAYSCFVETRRPAYLEEIKAGSNFEIVWFVRNTGTRAWDSGIDVKYASGPKMTTPERTEIKVAMNPGDIYKISLNAKAPKNQGRHTMTWIVEGQLCYANVTITVK